MTSQRAARLFTPKWFAKHIRASIAQADTRYTPDANVSLPIEEIFDGLGKTSRFLSTFQGFSDKCSKKRELHGLRIGLQEHQISSTQTTRRISKRLGDLVEKLKTINTSPFEGIDYRAIQRSIKSIFKTLGPIQDQLWELERKTRQETSETGNPAGSQTKKRSIRELLYDIREIQGLLREIDAFVEGSPAKLCNLPSLLLLGGPGMGKTHLLCDIAKRRVLSGLPTILILGQQLTNNQDPLDGLVGTLGANIAGPEFLSRLNRLAYKKGCRVLLLIDAINEGHRKSWKRYLRKFLEEARKHPGIAVALSCRIPFESVTVPKRARLIRVFHQGFAERELEALKVYFHRYRLPLPEVPLLTPEFTNPYFLKLFCETLENAVAKQQHRRIREISSGQEGMTNIFEDFVIARAKRISKTLGYEPLLIWKTLKETFASYMSDKKQLSIIRREALVLLSEHEPSRKKCESFLQALIHEGLLSEDVVYDVASKKMLEVVRFPYQKFSDHLIARCLLGKHFDRRSPEEAFKLGKPLGDLFKNVATASDNAGIIEALLIDFPERIRNSGELFDYLPDKKISGDLAALFVRGLYWRKPSSFNKSTDNWVNTLVNHEGFKNQVLDSLLALGIKPKHPYNATRLDRFLRTLILPKRDLFWSEFLRKQYEGDTAYRILAWIEGCDTRNLSSEQIAAYITVLKWFLTATNRPFRNRATHNIYRLGKQSPPILFKACLDSLSINDPYVPERMIAASYGVAMALHYGPKNRVFIHRDLNPLAISLYKMIFEKEAPFGTTNAVLREYAQRTIELALFHTPKLLTSKQKASITPPFRYGGIRNWGEEEDRDKKKDTTWRDGCLPMQMDFENYTLSRLVSNRRNYDYEHNEWKQVRANIFWRIYQLGYSFEAFGKIDGEINERNWDARDNVKVDRYGKKYCWIAFNELFGFRLDTGVISGRDPRPFEINLDPSFPEEPANIRIVSSNYLGNPSLSPADWVENGPVPDFKPYLFLKNCGGVRRSWVLLNGYVEQESRSARKDIFTFLRGFFVKQQEVETLIHHLEGLEYPGNQRLPDIESTRYIFSGEIPWCRLFSLPSPGQIVIPTGRTSIVRTPISGPNTTIVLAYGGRKKQFSTYSEEDFERGFQEHEKAEFLEFNVEVPVQSYSSSWEGTTSPNISACIPSKHLIDTFGLTSRPQTFDFYDPHNRKASLTCSWSDPTQKSQDLIYFRNDLLQQYLKNKQYELIWVVWGERRNRPEDPNLYRGETRYKVYKSIFTYRNVAGLNN